LLITIIIIIIIVISCHKEFSLICCIWQGRAGQAREGRAGQGRVFSCLYEGSDIRLKVAEFEEEISVF